MTPDQAAQLITAALRGPNDYATDAARELAERLALALDAIGLLAFASDPQQPRSRATDPETEKREITNWASLRSRSEPAKSLAEQYPGATLQDIHNRAKGEP